MNDEKYMDLAIAEAKKAFRKNEVPVGAVVIDKTGKVIGRGFNKKIKTKYIDAHAEMIAIKKACKKIGDWRLNDCSIYTTLEPCPMCASAIEQSRIKQVIYGASRQNQNEKIITEILKKTNIRKNVRNNQCAGLLTQFFKKQRQLFPGK